MTSDELKLHYQHRIERARQEAYDADLALQIITEMERLREQVENQAEAIKALEARIKAQGPAQ